MAIIQSSMAGLVPSQPRPLWVFGFQKKKIRRRHLFGSNSNDNQYDNIEHLNRVKLPENPEVNQAGHPNTYNFLIIVKLL